MRKPDYWIRVRDKNLQFIGEIDEGQYHEFDWELGWMEVGKWSMTAPFSSKAAQLLLKIAEDPNNGGIGGIYVERNGAFLFSGPLEEVHEEWDEEQGHVLKFNGYDELALIDRRLALPHPKRFTSPYMRISDGGTGWYHVDRFPNLNDTNTYKAGEAAITFIWDNIGESAAIDGNNQQPRRVPQIATKEPDKHAISDYYGANVTSQTPFRSRGERLLDMVQLISNFSEWNGYPIQIRGRQLDNVVPPDGDPYGGRRIYFEDMVSTNKPNVIFAPELGNMRAYKYSRVPPKANFVQVGGSGQGAYRVFSHAADEPSRKLHGDRELFTEYTGRSEPTGSDDQTKEQNAMNQLPELSAHVYATLAENAEETRLEIKPRDTEAVQFGRDWGPFDTVTVRIRGQETKNIIRVTSGKVDNNGEDISVVIGNQGAVSSGLRLFDRVNNLEYRYDGLTKRASSS
jgi:hypothetical protein